MAGIVISVVRGSIIDERMFSKMKLLLGDRCGRLTKNVELCVRFAEQSDITLRGSLPLEAVAVVLPV